MSNPIIAHSFEELENLLNDKVYTWTDKNFPHVVIAIDGRCGAGKTTFSSKLAHRIGAKTIHMDDYFLQPLQRTPMRLSTPGENIDHERLCQQVFEPLQSKSQIILQRYNCQSSLLEPSITIDSPSILILEGSYALHPHLRPFETITVFLDCTHSAQVLRLAKRDKIKLPIFLNRWIPMEESYRSTYQPEKNCNFYLDTTLLF